MNNSLEDSTWPVMGKQTTQAKKVPGLLVFFFANNTSASMLYSVTLTITHSKLQDSSP